ncbi:hypothetical protein BN2475_710055 [Paraburkholderia ribeironis]|uniref:Uncharacterized protein n=1 Tax=Paraburkholderia ribeironis TaxID=1247936 RepID=A0A1N7SI66_9BURK|nr:hypothetical protein BN2475_710055 [Paraburkholderia ribeironis]
MSGGVSSSCSSMGDDLHGDVGRPKLAGWLDLLSNAATKLPPAQGECFRPAAYGEWG